jgi:hypothetical protein
MVFGIRNYLDNVLQDNYAGSSLLGLTLVSSATDYIVGFNTLKMQYTRLSSGAAA